MHDKNVKAVEIDIEIDMECTKHQWKWRLAQLRRFWVRQP